MNLAEWLVRTAQRLPNAPALVSGDHIVADYATFARRAASIGAALRERFGIGPGDRLAIVMTNRLDYLELIHPVLARLSSRWPRLQLRVISSSFPDWHDVRIERVPWSSESEVNGLMTADIGVMPLANDEWTRGKCAFKLLQYSASGLACVATDIGANREAVIDGVTGYLVRSQEDWERAISTLLES